MEVPLKFLTSKPEVDLDGEKTTMKPEVWSHPVFWQPQEFPPCFQRGKLEMQDLEEWTSFLGSSFVPPSDWQQETLQVASDTHNIFKIYLKRH